MYATHPKHATWLGRPGTTRTFAETASAAKTGLRVVVITWDSTPEVSDVKLMVGDGRCSDCVVHLETQVATDEVEALADSLLH